MNHSLKLFFGLALLLVFGTSTGYAVQLYSQPSSFPLNTTVASQNAANVGNFATAYDNFSLGSASNVTGVSWQGGYFNPPAPGALSAFTLSFWADNAGQPGSLLLTETIVGLANQTFVGSNSSGLYFNYSLNLLSPFSAAAGTEYWLSVVADMNFPPQWGWATGIGGDGVAIQDFQGVRYLWRNDLAFTLNGNDSGVIPEPSTFVLLGAGLAGVGFLRRRMKM